VKASLVRLIVFVGVITFTSSSCFLPFLTYQLFTPEILYSQDYRLDEPGYTKTFNLSFKYYEAFILSLTNSDVGFPKDYEFNGKLRLQFFYKDKLVKEMEVKKWVTPTRWLETIRGINGKVHNYWRIYYLTPFSRPIEDKNNFTLKVTVISPDTNITEFKKRIKMVIVSEYE
jgi:hypothetical protein